MSIEKRDIEEIKSDIYHQRRLIRGYEIIIVLLSIAALFLFIKMAMKGSTILDLVSYTITLLLIFIAWNRGTSEEIVKVFNELELLNQIQKGEEDEINKTADYE